MKKETKEKIIEIMEENWVFTARYNRKKDIDSERRRVAKEILELLDQDKQKLIGEIEIALDKKYEEESDENIKQGISLCINMLVKFR